MSKKYTMNYTHQQIGGYDQADTRLYPREGELYFSDVYEAPAYSGKYQIEVRFRPDDRRLPDLTVATIDAPKQ